MSILRNMTVEEARGQRVSGRVAELTNLSLSAVRGRLRRAHGRSLLRNVFTDVWPSLTDELGSLPAVAAASDATVVAELGRLLQSPPPTIQRQLGRAAGATTVREALSSSWPSVAELGLEALGRLRAGEARAPETRGRIAELLNLSESEVARALGRAHGLSLVESVFAGRWPTVTKRGARSGNGKSAAPLIGGRYERIRKLGEGGAAVVWLGRDLDVASAPLVAMKFPKEPIVPAAAKELLREFEKATVVTHPNLCKYVRRALDEHDRPFLVIEYGGRSLRDSFAEPVGVDLALEWIVTAADALDHLHGAKIWHLDVKPANMLLDDRGVLRLTDFGIAKGVRMLPGGNRHATSTLLGLTPQYCAPELVVGEPAPTSDQYSLAATFCDLVAGEKGRELAKRLKPLDVLDAAQNRALRRALSLDPGDRFPSCTVFARALARDESWFALLSKGWSAFTRT